MAVQRTRVVALLLGVASVVGCAHYDGKMVGGPPTLRHLESPADPSYAVVLPDAVRTTMLDARRAVDEHGVTESAMRRIRDALARLAATPGLCDAYTMHDLHGGGASVAMLASEGPEGLTLTLARFKPGIDSPIHDHGSWAVVYVVEGRDQYVHWKREDDGSDPDRAVLSIDYERTLQAGDSVSWMDPPHDIHSQRAIDVPTWELILFGRSPMRDERQYFDPDSGHVTRRFAR